MLAARCLALKMELLFVNAVGSVILASTEGSIPESKLLCFGVNNQSYVCDSGHCCGESQCCSYYYELWWFWLVWTIIIILSCCCVCHHRRTKHRLQQQQRQHEINLIAYREAHNYASLPFYFRFLPSYLLPAYEEVENRPPTPPPPYSASQPGQPACLGSGSSEQLSDLCPAFQPVPVETACDPSGPGLGPEAPRSAIALCPAPAALKPHPGVEEPGRPQQQPPALGTDSPATPSLCKQGKELHLNPVEQGSPSGSDAKDRTPGRHRRFTGDSGIEVCVCSRGAEEEEEEEEMKELKGLLDREGLEEHDFCHSCNPQGGDGGPQGHGDQERGLAGPDRGPEPRDTPPQRPHVCLHLHTINEQEGVHHGNSAEAQS